MGYSCTTAALETLQRIAQVNCTGPESNVLYRDGVQIGFFERGKEQDDGAITGQVIAFYGEPDAGGNRLGRRAGSFRINADGTVVRFPLAKTKNLPPLNRRNARAVI